ncbi:MAG: hypothetical protein WBA12_13455 [Catalinimonas sp.]
MNDIRTVLAPWNPFFATLAGVSATIAGLLFVSLSLRYQEIGTDAYAAVRRFVRQLFRSLLFLMVFGLIFLIPTAVASGVSVPLVVVGIYALTMAVRTYAQDRRDEVAGHVRPVGAARFYVLSILTYVVLVAVAVFFWFGYFYAPFVLVGLLIWNLALATAGALELLLAGR